MEVIRPDKNGNKIVGYPPMTNNSTVRFIGKDNILYCDKNTTITDSIISFLGSNSLIYLGKSTHKVQIDIHHNSVFHSGSSNTCTDGKGYNRVLRIHLSEQKHCFLGNNNLISYDTVIRNSDPHLLYDCESYKRINSTKSVFIGDHVWIGQQVLILKGTAIDSGSVIGAASVVSGKKIPHNTIWGGSPARQIKEGIFWSSSCVHYFDDTATEASMNYADHMKHCKSTRPVDQWIFHYDQDAVIEWDSLESNFDHGLAMDKCNYLIKLNRSYNKNRFVHI